MGRLFVSVCEYPLINPNGIGSFSPATAGYGGDHGGKIVRQCVRVSTDQSQRDWIIQPSNGRIRRGPRWEDCSSVCASIH